MTRELSSRVGGFPRRNQHHGFHYYHADCQGPTVPQARNKLGVPLLSAVTDSLAIPIYSSGLRVYSSGLRGLPHDS